MVYLCQIPAAGLAADPNLAVLAPLGLRASLNDLVAAKDTLTNHLPRAEQADQLAALYIVGGRRFDLVALRRILSEEQLMESVTYRDIIEKGIEKGVVKGRRLALHALLERQAERRFPGTAAQLAPLLDRCSADELETVGEAVVTAPTVEALSQVITGVLEDSLTPP